MIQPQERFGAFDGGGYFGPFENPKTEAHCNVWDWDQLRMVKIIGTAKLLPVYQEKEVSILAQFADCLSPEVHTVTVDDDGLLRGLSTDPEKDGALFVGYLPFSTVESLADCRTIRYFKLQELDRLGPGVDLLSYEDESGNLQKVAFKFNPFEKPRSRKMAWNELHILKKSTTASQSTTIRSSCSRRRGV